MGAELGVNDRMQIEINPAIHQIMQAYSADRTKQGSIQSRQARLAGTIAYQEDMDVALDKLRRLLARG